MEIYKELIDFTNKIRSASEIVTELEEQENEIKKKKHLIKVLNIYEGLKESVKNNQFEEHNIKFLELYYVHDHDYDDQNNGYVIRYELINDNNKKITRNHNNKHLIDRFDDYCDYLSNFNPDNINQNFEEKEKINLNVNENLPEKFLDLMLSNELKLIFQYNDLQNSLLNKEVIPKENKAKI